MTKIEWCDITINPVVGCSKCSPGCEHCYAERFAARLAKNPKTAAKYAGVVDAQGKWTGKIDGLWMHNIVGTHSKKCPKRIFMGSMSDFFHDGVSDDMLFKMFAFAALCPQHTFIFLTKRPERMRNFMGDTSPRANDCRGREYRAIGNILGCDINMDGLCWPLPNVWLGVTVCNQDEADAKIPVLLDTPAAKRFVSVEPMLVPVDLSDYIGIVQECSCGFIGKAREARGDEADYEDYCPDCGDIVTCHDISGLDWVICGGETGPGARPMHPDWVRGLRDQCVAAGVQFFFKGWGEWTPGEYDHSINGYVIHDDTKIPDGTRSKEHIWSEHLRSYKVGKRRFGRLLDGREWNEVPA